MESDDTNFVTIPSKDLGPLKSITVANDGTRNRPDWKILDIAVSSARWLKPDIAYHYTARFNATLKGHSSLSQPFQLDEFVSAASTSSGSQGTLANPRKRVVDAYAEVAPGGVIHVAAGRYNEKLRLSKPCSLVFWTDHGATPAVIGSP